MHVHRVYFFMKWLSGGSLVRQGSRQLVFFFPQGAHDSLMDRARSFVVECFVIWYDDGRVFLFGCALNISWSLSWSVSKLLRSVLTIWSHSHCLSGRHFSLPDFRCAHAPSWPQGWLPLASRDVRIVNRICFSVLPQIYFAHSRHTWQLWWALRLSAVLNCWWAINIWIRD